MVGFVDTQDNMKNFDQKFAGKDAGPYVGTVKFTDDPLRQGRLGVNIPDLSHTDNPGPDDCIWCQYLSPFYGAKSIEANSKSDADSYKGTQHTYGMWFVPPDIDTQVLVIFAKGETSKKSAFWIGCVQQPLTNQQVPGYSSSSNNYRAKQDAREINRTGATNYGTDFLPVGEKNRKMLEEAQTAAFANSLQYPINDVMADQLLGQGLVQDTVRGTTSSSARRESPSQVFGINTPGRIREDSRRKNIGPEGAEVRPDRDTGHSFVMDDGAEDGTNQLTRLRTASGHQLLMHDTEGVVYLANGSGKAFIEMDKEGTISVYSDGGINLRSRQDFNLHCDRNINFHAKGQINFTSETNVALNAEGYLFAMGDKGIFSSSQNGVIQDYAKTAISSHTPGLQLHGADREFHLQGSQVHFNKPMGRQVGIDAWGPSWLKPDTDYVRIRTTGGEAGTGDKALIDVDNETPIDKRSGKVVKKAAKTTVTDFVTHEPYDRQSSTARIKTFVNEAMEQISKSSPELSASEKELIKAELLKQPTIKAVADTLSKVVKLNDVIELPTEDLNELLGKANDIQKLIEASIEDPKGAAMNFVVGLIDNEVGQAIVRNTLRKVKEFFTGGSGGRDRDDIA